MSFKRHILLFVLLIVSTPARAIDSIVFDKRPIPLTLTVGVEQIVQFSGPAMVGLTPLMAKHDVFRHLFTADTAYWTAIQPFETQRVKVRLEASGNYILFDISAVEEKNPPLKKDVLSVSTFPDADRVEASQIDETSQPGSTPHATSGRKQDHTMFDLIRFAVQRDRAPDRAVKPLNGVTNTDIGVRRNLSSLYWHKDNASIEIYVHHSWGYGGWYVTSLAIHNQSEDEITIDPSKIQTTRWISGVTNKFVASAMVDRQLPPKSAGSAVHLYVVTDQPLDTVIEY